VIYKTYEIKIATLERDLPDSNVPCQDINCVLCCVKLSPFLTETEFKSGKYIYTLIDGGDPDKPFVCIPRTDFGCVYLDHNKQCTIYDYRPLACRQFDCRLNHSPIINDQFK
jgi:Fe-S-cluster containining protein